MEAVEAKITNLSTQFEIVTKHFVHPTAPVLLTKRISKDQPKQSPRNEIIYNF